MDNDEYSNLRQRNIERNKRFLQEIGLESSVIRSTDIAGPEKKQLRKRKLPGADLDDQSLQSRRSLRIAILPTPSYKDDMIQNNRPQNTREQGSEREEEVKEKQSWSPRGPAKGAGSGTGAEDGETSCPLDSSKSSGCPMQLEHFYPQLGEELEIFGKAHVMTMANGGTLPRFSKYSGVAPWANGYFLWINIDVDPVTGRRSSDHPNEFLDGGERMTWFGGSVMHPESPTVMGLLRAGRAAADTDRGEDKELEEQQQEQGNVIVFVREVKRPYSCFGRVALEAVDLAARPVRMTWRFLDYHTRLQHCQHFCRIARLAGGLVAARTGPDSFAHGLLNSQSVTNVHNQSERSSARLLNRDC